MQRRKAKGSDKKDARGRRKRRETDKNEMK